MAERERKLARMRLDEAMRPYRRAGLNKDTTMGLLREVRKALGIPMAEVARRMGVDESVVFEIEACERRGTAKVCSMARVAAALECKVVYGIVPVGGKTLEWLAEKRIWAGLLEEGRDLGLG